VTEILALLLMHSILFLILMFFFLNFLMPMLNFVYTCVLVKCIIISGTVMIMQLGKEYLNSLTCKFFRMKFGNF